MSSVLNGSWDTVARRLTVLMTDLLILSGSGEQLRVWAHAIIHECKKLWDANLITSGCKEKEPTSIAFD